MADNIVSYCKLTHNLDAASGDILPQDQLYSHLTKARALSNFVQIFLQKQDLSEMSNQTLCDYFATLDDHIEGAYRAFDKL